MTGDHGPESADEARSTVRILYVDDSADLAEVVEAQLERQWPSFEVHTTTDPLGVPSILANQPVDVIVSDQHMPAQPGVELLAELRGRGYRQPFILFTSDDSVSLDGIGDDSGVVSLLVKDVSDASFSRLATRIREHLAEGPRKGARVVE